MRVMIINGPNLNLLGKREPEVYGHQSFDDYYRELKSRYPVIRIDYFQSNAEGALIDKLHEVGFHSDGIILNAGALSHTSLALKDAIAAITSPVIEVHISNVYAREAYRHHSQLSEKCLGVLVGFGLFGYDLAIQYLIHQQRQSLGQ